MKQNNFQLNLIAASVAMTLGVSGTAFAASSGEVKPADNDKPTITNIATASYSVDGVVQPEVESNEVKVTLSPVSEFSLVGLDGEQPNDDMNEDQPATPGGKTTFKNKLTNQGNSTDTYTLTIDDNGNDPDISTAEPNYQFTNVSDMTVQIYNQDGDKVGEPKTIANGGTVTLDKGQYAEITYQATSPESVKGGDDATLTLSATSEDIQALDPEKATLVNESQAEVKLPVFSIVKSASVSKVNLNDADPKFFYTIKVTNDADADYTTAAVNALIQDKLPAGLSVDGGKSAITVSSDNDQTDQGVLQDITEKDGRQVVSLQDVDIAVGETITIKIPVKVTDKEVLKAAGSATNNADVYDNYDDESVDPNNPDNADIHDSTDNATDNPHTADGDDGTNPDDPNNPGGDKPGPKVDFTDRSVTLEDTSSKELPPTSGEDHPATYDHTIVNNGNQDETGMKVEITDPNGNTVDVEKVTYDPTPDDTSNDDVVTLIPDDDGKYEIPTIKPGQKGKLSYDVVTDNATPGDYETTVTVTPAPGKNDDAPTVPSKTDTTEVKQLVLEKKQVLDESCDIDVSSASGFTKGAIDAKPGQCVIYRITAMNGFTTKQLTNVTIQDSKNNWNDTADYVENTATATAGTVSDTGNAVKASGITLDAQGSENLSFKIKIKTDLN